jgi:Mn-containing catalase
MFLRQNRLQYNARPERPDPVYAKQLQEVLGGQWGEISVMMTYLFQGWNCRGPAKYKDMIMDIGTEEIGHVEMLATMIAACSRPRPWRPARMPPRTPRSAPSWAARASRTPSSPA